MTPKKKKLLFFIATLSQGGAERLISELSFRLQDFDIVIVISENKVSYPCKGKLVVLGVPLPENFFAKIYCYFVRFFRLRNVVEREKPDFVVSFGAFANVLNVFLPARVILHTDAFYSKMRTGFWGIVLKLFARFFLNKVRIIIPMSKGAAHDLVKNYGVDEKKIKVIYNPLNLEKIQKLALEPLDTAFENLFSRPAVITMGRFSKEKGQWHLIKAFKNFKKTAPNAILIFLGEGALEKDLRKLSQDLQVANDVYFLGWQGNPFRFLARAEMFVFPSSFEGLPAALLEALACGVPVISSDCRSGPREILAPKTSFNTVTKEIEAAEYGFLVPVPDETLSFSKELTREEELLSQAMAKLHHNASLREDLREKAKNRAQDFSVERIIREWEPLLQNV